MQLKFSKALKLFIFDRQILFIINKCCSSVYKPPYCDSQELENRMCACSWVPAQQSPFLSACLCPSCSLACRAEAIILALGLLLYTITVIFHSHFHCFNFREFPFLFLTFSCLDLSRKNRESHLKNATNSQ